MLNEPPGSIGNLPRNTIDLLMTTVELSDGAVEFIALPSIYGLRDFFGDETAVRRFLVKTPLNLLGLIILNIIQIDRSLTLLC